MVDSKAAWDGITSGAVESPKHSPSSSTMVWIMELLVVLILFDTSLHPGHCHRYDFLVHLIRMDL